MLTHTFVDVIVPLPLAGYFTYAVPTQWVEQVKVGCRVVVPFGNRKFYTAVVRKIHHIAPTEYKVKELYELLDMAPILLPEQLKLWQWMADYYLCTPGEVLKAALPSGLKVESETLVAINEEWDAEQSLTPHQDRVMQVLNTATEMTMAALMRATGLTNCMSIVKGLLEKRAVVVMESLKRNYKPKQEQRIKIASAFIHESALGEVCDKLERRSPKQFLLLMTYLEMVGETGRSTQQAVGKHLLLKKSGVSAAALTGLCKKGVLENFQVEIGHLKQVKVETQSIYPLNSFQQVAFEQVLEAWQTKEVCLLHGVTSSGKTEVYIHLIHQTIERGEQVLYLLPEIALTTQITTRLRRVFGDKLGIYHSKFSDAERVDIWQKQLSENPFQVILGVRSSIFLPFAKLGLVIVDEEHEASYKQQDPAPRYHGRNVALVLAAQLGAKCLLGTATPSIESAYNAVTGKYGRVFINERYKSIQLPEVVPVDIKELYRKKRMKGMFSPLLIEEMTTALEKKEQIILFQNRRGFAPMVECKMCGWVPKCVNCDVSLTYHKGIHQLTCHYCGYTQPVPTRCPSCGEENLSSRGFGTEKVEEEVKALFPEATVGRMDLDTTRTRAAYERLLYDFEEGKTDILIGTQMISKGLDFDGVRVVGILNADSMLNYPDFRAYERAFQLMAQVAGRAGRKHKQGLVILQTRSIEHPIIHQVMQHDYKGLYATQLEERELFRYPPFYRLIYVFLKGKRASQLDLMAYEMADRLKATFGDRVLGPDNPPVGRIQTWYIKKIMIKVETKLSAKAVRQWLRHIQAEMLQDTRFKQMQVYYDVDPM